jgi:hypothetical protein
VSEPKSMRTSNGLTVPVGYGGAGNVRLKGELRGGAKSNRVERPARDRRHVNAEDAKPGQVVRGAKGNTYEVLDVTDRGTGYVEVLVLSKSTGKVRTWVRNAKFGLELA